MTPFKAFVQSRQNRLNVNNNKPKTIVEEQFVEIDLDKIRNSNLSDVSDTNSDVRNFISEEAKNFTERQLDSNFEDQEYTQQNNDNNVNLNNNYEKLQKNADVISSNENYLNQNEIEQLNNVPNRPLLQKLSNQNNVFNQSSNSTNDANNISDSQSLDFNKPNKFITNYSDVNYYTNENLSNDLKSNSNDENSFKDIVTDDNISFKKDSNSEYYSNVQNVSDQPSAPEKTSDQYVQVGQNKTVNNVSNGSDEKQSQIIDVKNNISNTDNESAFTNQDKTFQNTYRSIDGTANNQTDLNRSIDGTANNQTDLNRSIDGTTNNQNDLYKSIDGTTNNQNTYRSIDGTANNQTDLNRSIDGTTNNQNTYRSIDGTTNNQNDYRSIDGTTNNQNNQNDLNKSIDGTTNNQTDLNSLSDRSLATNDRTSFLERRNDLKQNDSNLESTNYSSLKQYEDEALVADSDAINKISRQQFDQSTNQENKNQSDLESPKKNEFESENASISPDSSGQKITTSNDAFFKSNSNDFLNTELQLDKTNDLNKEFDQTNSQRFDSLPIFDKDNINTTENNKKLTSSAETQNGNIEAPSGAPNVSANVNSQVDANKNTQDFTNRVNLNKNVPSGNFDFSDNDKLLSKVEDATNNNKQEIYKKLNENQNSQNKVDLKSTVDPNLNYDNEELILLNNKNTSSNILSYEKLNSNFENEIESIENLNLSNTKLNEKLENDEIYSKDQNTDGVTPTLSKDKISPFLTNQTEDLSTFEKDEISENKTFKSKNLFQKLNDSFNKAANPNKDVLDQKNKQELNADKSSKLESGPGYKKLTLGNLFQNNDQADAQNKNYNGLGGITGFQVNNLDSDDLEDEDLDKLRPIRKRIKYLTIGGNVVAALQVDNSGQISKAQNDNSSNEKENQNKNLEDQIYANLLREREILQSKFSEFENNKAYLRKAEENIQNQLVYLITNDQLIEQGEANPSSPVNQIIQNFINEDRVTVENFQQETINQALQTFAGQKEIDEVLLRQRIERELRFEFNQMQLAHEQKMKIVYRRMIESMYSDLLNS